MHYKMENEKAHRCTLIKVNGDLHALSVAGGDSSSQRLKVPFTGRYASKQEPNEFA